MPRQLMQRPPTPPQQYANLEPPTNDDNSQQSTQFGANANHFFNPNFKMGIQSQKRDGAIRKCKERGTKRKTTSKFKIPKTVQKAIDGGVGFIPKLHCLVCKAMDQRSKGLDVRIPKRAHFVLCPKNRKTKGQSYMSVFVNKEAAKNITINNAPIEPAAIPPNSTTYKGFFSPRQQTPRTTTDTQFPVPNMPLPPSPVQSTTVKIQSLVAAPRLRKEVDCRMKEYLQEQSYTWLKKAKYPAAIGLLVDFIVGKVEHRKPADLHIQLPTTLANHNAMEVYHSFFPPGETCFTIPQHHKKHTHDVAPSPYYDAIAGNKIYFIDWKLIYPPTTLYCFNCKNNGTHSDLVHDRTNFSKNKTLFPLWDHSGVPSWCVVMQYKCKHCNVTYAGNDGRVLATLPPHVAAAYPVIPSYASGMFHFHQNLTDDLEITMRTYANAKFIRDKLYRK